jgi:hypothetical protein
MPTQLPLTKILHVVGSAMTDGRMSVRFSVLNSSRNSITGTLEGGERKERGGVWVKRYNFSNVKMWYI